MPIEFNGNAKVWSNHLENRDESRQLAARNTEVYQVLKPRHLCFLRNPNDPNLHGIDIRPVEEWEQSEGRGVNLSYVFIAYFTGHFPNDDYDALMDLSRIAEKAARDAGAVAYWVGASNMKDEQELESDVSCTHRLDLESPFCTDT